MTIVPEFSDVPPELRELKRWICWREEWRGGKKPTKVPLAPWTGKNGPVNALDSANWTTLEEALRWAKKLGLGVGIVLGEVEPGKVLTGVDLDHVIEEGGIIKPGAVELIQKTRTYAELSPSLRGIHVLGWVEGPLPHPLIHEENFRVEAYTGDRWFTLTGRRWKEAPLGLGDLSPLIRELQLRCEKEPVGEVLKEDAGLDCVEVFRAMGGDLGKLRKVGDQLQGPHPTHGSESGMNFTLHPRLGWFCFRHWRGGGSLSLAAVMAGILRCEEVGPGCLKGKMGEVMRILRERGIEVQISEPDTYFDEGGRFQPIRLAEDIKKKEHFATHRESWVIYRYNGGRYLKDGEARIRELARELLGEEARERRISEVVLHIRDTTFRDPKEFEAPSELLCVENGILNVLTGELKPHTPDVIFLHKVPIKYDPKAKCPTVIKRFWEWTGSLKGVMQLIQLCGFFLYRKYFLRKAIILYGEGSNGKTTFLLFLIGWLGEENFTSVPVQNLRHRFATSRLYGKLANIVDELPTEAWVDTEAFKMATGDSPLTGEEKFKKPFTFWNYAKFVMAGNRLPVVADDTKAFWDRILLIPFGRTFDPDAPEEVKARRREEIVREMLAEEEKSGLLNLALLGLRSLLETQKFYGEEDVEKVKAQYVKISDPVMAFARERLVEDPEGEVVKEGVYAAYVEWCKSHGFPIKENNAFARALKRVFPRVEEKRSLADGGRPRVWVGIRLKEGGVQDVQDVQVFPYPLFYSSSVLPAVLKILHEYAKSIPIPELEREIEEEVKKKPGQPGQPGHEDTLSFPEKPEEDVCGEGDVCIPSPAPPQPQGDGEGVFAGSSPFPSPAVFTGERPVSSPSLPPASPPQEGGLWLVKFTETYPGGLVGSLPGEIPKGASRVLTGWEVGELRRKFGFVEARKLEGGEVLVVRTLRPVPPGTFPWQPAELPAGRELVLLPDQA
ncbi:MAG: phage/plasmid primase, P4 family [Candidatus Hadarchaeales archaeon]